MDYCKREINLVLSFAKLNDQDIQKLQRFLDKYIEFYQYLLENMVKESMFRFHRSTQKQLYIMGCSYEKDHNHLLDFVGLTCAFNILTDLINDKYYNQSQSPIKGNQSDGQGDIEKIHL